MNTITRSLARTAAVLMVFSLVPTAFAATSASASSAKVSATKSDAVHNAGPAVVDLGTSGNFTILAQSGISTTGTTAITGDIGVSPIASTAVTGFGLIPDSSGQFATSSLVTGKVYAADYSPPTPANLTTAVGDMQTAYTDAAGRTNPTAVGLGGGDIDGLTVAPGLYKWSSGVTVPTNVTLSGGANDVWIFQIAGTLDFGSGAIVHLTGGAQPSNIFWQVAGQTTLESTSNVSGTILDQTAIVMDNGATLNGKALAQTAVSLIANDVGQYMPRLSWSQPADIVYGTALSSAQLDATADVPGSFAYAPDLGTVLSAGQDQSLGATFTPTDTTDYVGGGQVSTTINVDPATLTFTSHDKSVAYGAAMPAKLDYSTQGFVNGDRLKFMPALPTCSSTVSSTAGHDTSPPGAYDITCSGAANPNYTFVYVSGTFSVYRARLTITADDKTATFGQPMPSLTYSAVGFVNGEDASNLSSQPTCVSDVRSSNGVVVSNAGTSYAITCNGGSDPNYAVNNYAGTLTVQPATLTVTAYDKSAIYGGVMPQSFTYLATGFVNGNTAARTFVTNPVCTPTAESANGLDTSGFGIYAIDCSGAVAPNYTVDYVPGTFTVYRALLTITADDKTATLGQSLPALTYSAVGFVNGDNASDLSSQPTCVSTVRTSNGVVVSNPGPYAITCKGASNPNYGVVNVAGTLTVQPAI